VTIQDPKGLHWGGYLGGPVFKKVMSFVLKDKAIKPTAPATVIYAHTAKELKAKIDLMTGGAQASGAKRDKASANG
jgi:cell division protein FtsI (penicillin-binding protein 3)